MLGLVAKGQELGGDRIWPGCPWVKAYTVGPACGGLDLGGCMCAQSSPPRRGTEESRCREELSAGSVHDHQPEHLLQMGKLRPREQKHLACSHGRGVWHQAWKLPRLALVCSPIPLGLLWGRGCSLRGGPHPLTNTSHCLAFSAHVDVRYLAWAAAVCCWGVGACRVGQCSAVRRHVVGAVLMLTAAEGPVFTHPLGR